MPVSSSTEHWIKPDALTINLNHFGDPDHLQVSVLAGAVVMAFKQDVIGYNAAHNYRTWPLDAANTYLETSSAYNVYARLTRSEVNARALVIYDPILRDVEGRELTYEKNEETGEVKEILGEPNENFYFIFLGQLSSSISEDGRSVLREWTSEYRSGSLETNEQQNDWMVILNKMFRPHYDDPLNPDTLTWIEAKAHMGVAGGLTSFIDNGSLKLPSIYDGLPIDNQTLYWEEVKEEVGTDEEGNPIYETTKVLKAAGGGGGTGGGSVQYPLSWSGFSNGSWNGSEAKTIQIPSKLSDLENDVIVFREDGWGDAFRIRPSFSGAGDNNYLAIERSVGSSEEEPFFNDCLKIRGMTGKIEHICTNETALSIQHLSDNHWNNAFLLMNPTMAEGRYEQFQIGKEMSPYNCGNIGFQFFRDGELENLMTIGLNGADNILNVTGWKRVGINTSAPRNELEVKGKIGVTNGIILYGKDDDDPDDVEFVFNENNSITNIKNSPHISIRHSLRFNWHGDAYEIGAVRGGGAEARGFGVTYGNHTLIFEASHSSCEFHKPVNVRNGLFVQGNVEFVDNVKFDKPMNFIGNAGWNDISFVYNEDGVLKDETYDYKSIRHALRFQWFKDAYEIGAVRTDWDEALGFGVTYNNNQLVWKVNREQMDVYGNLIVKGIVDSVTITSLQEQLNGLWKRNWFDDLSATMIMADNASFERLYGDSIIIGDCKLSYDYEKETLVIQKFDGTDTNVVISGGLTTYSTEV